MPLVSTVGLMMPDDFPAASYQRTFDLLRTNRDTHNAFFKFGTAWNAVAYRYRAMVDAGEDFAKSVRLYGPHPPPEPRYGQEKSLLEFFSAGFAAFEASFFGLYAIGAMVAGSQLTLATPRDEQSVSPSKTHAAFVKAFPGDPVVDVLGAVIEDGEFKSFRETRNILTHRTAPGRTMYANIGIGEDLPTEWKLNNRALDATIATEGRSHVSRLLTALIDASADFAARKLAH